MKRHERGRVKARGNGKNRGDEGGKIRKKKSRKKLTKEGKQ